MTGDDFKIIADYRQDGGRHIIAVPSSLVCSTKIEFDLVDGKIRNLRYERGCDGNLRAIGKLLEGMDAEKAVEILGGNDCHERGTSCADQLTRVIKACLG